MQEVLARLACDSLRSSPPPVLSSLLKLLWKLSQDAKALPELLPLPLCELLLELLTSCDGAMRRMAAEIFVRISSQRPLPAPALCGAFRGRPVKLPRAFETWQGDGLAQPTLSGESCARALKRRLEAWKARPMRAEAGGNSSLTRALLPIHIDFDDVESIFSDLKCIDEEVEHVFLVFNWL